MEAINVYRLDLVRERTWEYEEHVVCLPGIAAEVIGGYLKAADREHLVVLLLNAQNRPIGINTVSIGALDMSVAHPREVFKPAIIGNAAAIILGHNHPSGDPMPSSEDVAMTRKMKEVGALLGIRVEDHIIVAEGGRFASLRERCLM